MISDYYLRVLRLAFFSATAFALIMALIPKPPPVPGVESDKVLHMIAFATLATLAGAAYPKVSLWKMWLGFVAFGAMIELLQMTPGLNRDAQFMDLVADAFAAGVVLGLYALWRRRRPVA